MILIKRGVRRGDVYASLAERLADKIAPEPNSGCWLWTGSVSHGYGEVYVNDVKKPRRAHRIVYEAMRGRIPDGLTLDHLCRNRACVNPAHLEPVTTGENTRRATMRITHCPQRHPYNAANTYWRRGKHRECRTCHRTKVRAYLRVKRAALRSDLA